MYAYIKGILVHATPSSVILDTQGVGWQLLIPFSHFAKLPPLGQPLQLFTTFIVREDSQRLYGFLAEPERTLFEDLIAISGVGPKTAIGLVGHMDLYDLQTAIQQGQPQRLCKIPGIGKKTAERLIIELRDKISLKYAAPLPKRNATIADATSALLNLGYNAPAIQKAIQQIPPAEELELSTLITSILRII
jgi:Holliday junction DNA helicase RuvA